jgi:tripartite-type tricarboxylate transporter receptor subunit TctC
MRGRSIALAASLMAAIALLPPLLPQTCAAQSYPAKPVKIVVPAQPGGGLDLIGRTVGEQLGRSLGQSFIIENIAGGGGAIACQTVARAAADGYTLMVGYVATHATNPAVRKVPYDPVKDFTPIAMVGGTPNLIVTGPALPLAELKALIDYAKKSAGKLTFGSGGIGSLNHLVLEQFKGAAGFDAVTAHYRGIGPAFVDLLGGQVHVMAPGLAAALPHIRASKVRPVAITGLKRHPLLPDVPTFEESGFQGFDGVQWYGIVGPAKLPSEITNKLSAEIGKALASPAFQQRLAAEAIDPMPMTPQQFGELIQSEIARYSALARERKISLDE